MVKPRVTNSVKKIPAKKRTVVAEDVKTAQKMKKPAVKKATKRTSTTAKKTTPKPVKKTAKKRASTTTKKSPLKEKAEKTFFTKEKSKDTKSTPEIVTVPTNMSLRAKRKADAISKYLTEDFYQPARKIAYVSGLSFVLMGAVISFSYTSTFAQISKSSFFANLASTTETVNTAVETTQEVLYPDFISIDHQIPSEMTADEKFLLNIVHAEQVFVKLLSLETAEYTELQVSKPTTDTYRFTIPASSLTPGEYSVKLLMYGTDSTYAEDMILGDFVVPRTELLAPEIDLLTNIDSTLSADLSVYVTVLHASNPKAYLYNTDTLKRLSTNITRESGTDKYKIFIPSSSLVEGEYDLELDFIDAQGNAQTKKLDSFAVVRTAEEVTDVATTTTSSNNTTETVSDTTPVVASEETSDAEEIEIIIRTPVSEFTKPDTLQIFAPMNATFVRLYYRNEQSSTKSPLGYAIKGTDRWLYRFDPTMLPNATYYLTANAKVADTIHVSKSQKVRVAVPVLTTVINSTNETIDTTEREIVPPEEDEFEEQEREVETRELLRIEQAIEDVVKIDDDASRRTDELLLAYKIRIDELLKNYAVAQQSGNVALIESARRALEDIKQELLREVLLDEELRELADVIDQRLTQRITALQEKVDTFEELRKTTESGTEAIDTDGDGITDKDERLLYGTNPELQDTDGDGVSDGVEIVKGYNPLDSNPETLILYESPKDSVAYTEVETLKVEKVTPLVRGEVNQENPPVSAEIRGKGIPNSFVTLYIFSTPTVVTVKTESDGSFVYTFEDELEDGEHEVYVAVTDNAGEIIAQSNPFRFVKEAEAFTPEDEESATPVVSSIDNTVSENPYIAVAGLGILGLGLVLLMLGLAMKEPEKEITLVEDIKVA